MALKPRGFGTRRTRRQHCRHAPPPHAPGARGSARPKPSSPTGRGISQQLLWRIAWDFFKMNLAPTSKRSLGGSAGGAHQLMMGVRIEGP